MKNICIAYMLLATMAVQAQTKKEKILYGICTKDSLLQEPYSKWFQENYNTYTINNTVLTSLQQTNKKGYSFQLFFGTWCGDSKREVPKMYKVLDGMSIPATQIQLVALGNSDSLYKKSPTGEHINKYIFRVPVLIVYKNGKEVQRINESPATSTEMDLLQIFNNDNYQPNYASFATISNWMKTGVLLDDNTTAAGLANQLRGKVSGENELNSLGYLLLGNKQIKEALKIFKINYNLFPTSANIMSSLGEGFLKNNEKEKAITFLEMALQENKDKAQFKGILDLLYEAKGIIKK